MDEKESIGKNLALSRQRLKTQGKLPADTGQRTKGDLFQTSLKVQLLKLTETDANAQ